MPKLREEGRKAGSADRLIMANPDGIHVDRRGRKHNVVLVTDHAICWGRVSDSDLDLIEVGNMPLGEVGTKLDQMAPFDALSWVNANERRATLQVATSKGTLSAALTSQSDNIEDLVFSEASLRDAVYDALRRKLEPQFRHTRKEWSVALAIMLPLILLALTAACTWAVHGMAQDVAAGVSMEDRGWKTRLFVPVVEAIGPIGVLVVGGIVAALTLLWMAKLIKSPPIISTLKREKQKKAV